jgi:hypothetical protein
MEKKMVNINEFGTLRISEDGGFEFFPFWYPPKVAM